MTEADWLDGTNLDAMLSYLQGKASDRKLRLVACAACRRIWHVIQAEESRQAVEVSERYADGQASARELKAARKAAVRIATTAAENRTLGWNAAQTAAETAGPALEAARRATSKAADADLLREVFGNPFRPLRIDPAWLRRNDGRVVQIAQAIYDERWFRDLPILADALEEAGCADADILAHCRNAGVHARGCWVLDGLLGKK
jgi:hypothetical protein